MAKSHAISEKSPYGFGNGEITVMVCTNQLYRELSDIAAQRGQTVAEALQLAVKMYVAASPQEKGK